MAKRKSKGDSDNWRDANQRILDALDLAAEYAALGVAITGAKPNRRGWLECHAVGGEPDNTPSAAINVAGAHPLLGRYKDSRGGNNCQPQTRTLSLFDFAAAFGPFATWQEARQHFADKAGVKLPGESTDEDKRPDDRVEITGWCETLAAMWLFSERARGISMDALTAAGGCLAKWPKGSACPNFCIAVPAWGPHFSEADPTGYVIWNQNGRTLPVFRKEGEPLDQKKMLAIGSGWVVVGNLSTAETVWKTEGPTDLLALWTAAIADPDAAAAITAGKLAAFTNACGANEHVDTQLVAHLAGKQVLLVHDADTPGESGATEKWLPAIASVAREVRHVRLPYDVRSDHGRDLRDYLHDDGNAYAKLVGLAEAAAVLAAPSTGGPGPIGPIEADDDPHRLARVNLTKLRSMNRDLKFWRDEWYVWKGPKYRKITTQEFRAKLSQSIKEEFDRLNISARQSASVRHPGESKKVTRSLTTNVMEATAGMTVVSSSIEQMTWLPDRSRRRYISMANGLLDIDAVLSDSDDYLLPHSPDWFSVVSLPYDFVPSAECPKWLAFLNNNLEGDAERISLLQEWAGYLLLPDTGQQKFLLMEGEGSNGKSVYFAAITGMLGEDNVSNISLEVFGDRFSRTETLGKLANISGDCEELDKVAEGYIKNFTGGDRMFFDRKGISGLNCVPTARMMIACNERPKIRDRSGGIWRRMIPVPWQVIIKDEDKIRNMDKPSWWHDSGELPGIFWWALQGMQRLREKGQFTDSSVSNKIKGEYQVEMNSAKAFIKEFTAVKDGEFIRLDWLYRLYCEWAKSGNYKPFGRPVFGKEIQRFYGKQVDRKQRREIGTTTGPRHWCYINLKLRNLAIPGINTLDAVSISSEEIKDDDDDNAF